VPDTPLWKKLGIKPGYCVLVLNAPAGYETLLGDFPEGVELSTEVSGDGQFDVVHAYVSSRSDLDRLAEPAMSNLKPGGALWFSYPKKSSKVKTDMDRDNNWEPLTGAGLRVVTAISIDDTWSGLRFRPVSDVKSSKG